MPSKSKSKGSQFEREYAKFLTELFSAPFHRVVNSGAYIGGQNAVRKSQLDENQAKSFKGDINAPDSWRNWNSELKSYADFPFHQLTSGRVQMLDTWIDQCMSVADKNDFSFVAFKISRKGCFIAVKNQHPDLTFVNNFVYNNKKWGEWIIMDNAVFWQLNAAVVEKICQLANN